MTKEGKKKSMEEDQMDREKINRKKLLLKREMLLRPTGTKTSAVFHRVHSFL